MRDGRTCRRRPSSLGFAKEGPREAGGPRRAKALASTPVPPLSVCVSLSRVSRTPPCPLGKDAISDMPSSAILLVDVLPPVYCRLLRRAKRILREPFPFVGIFRGVWSNFVRASFCWKTNLAVFCFFYTVHLGHTVILFCWDSRYIELRPCLFCGFDSAAFQRKFRVFPSFLAVQASEATIATRRRT